VFLYVCMSVFVYVRMYLSVFDGGLVGFLCVRVYLCGSVFGCKKESEWRCERGRRVCMCLNVCVGVEVCLSVFECLCVFVYCA